MSRIRIGPCSAWRQGPARRTDHRSQPYPDTAHAVLLESAARRAYAHLPCRARESEARPGVFPALGTRHGPAGAITIRPADGEEWPPDDRDTTDESDRDDDRNNALRFSLAGVQLKFSAINEAREWTDHSGKGIGGSWIVKLPRANLMVSLKTNFR